MTALTLENTTATPYAESALELGINTSLLEFLISITSPLASAVEICFPLHKTN